MKSSKADPKKIMQQATKTAKAGQLNAMKKVYGNDRGAFLHKQATKPQGGNHKAIGKAC